LAREGKIPGFKVGEQWRFDVQEIEEWKKNQGVLKKKK
ncbi:MAG: helix-turn-helix domain-containing protein, partial [Candidatus Omnitrophica bacterium]|nr:helix-turn-helix domain-containing protein [Candidatus Omnitrophota bacterium]